MNKECAFSLVIKMSSMKCRIYCTFCFYKTLHVVVLMNLFLFDRKQRINNFYLILDSCGLCFCFTLCNKDNPRIVLKHFIYLIPNKVCNLVLCPYYYLRTGNRL